jgi:hypothetical protein
MLIISQCNFIHSQIFQWEDPIKISNNPEGWCDRPSICNDSEGNLFVAYSHYNLRDSKRLYFNSHNGDNWQGVDTLYQHEVYNAYDTKLVCDNEDNLHLAAEIAYGEYSRIYYMKNEGNGWSDLIQISVDSLGNPWDHDMVVDQNGRVYIFFRSRDIYYRTYEDSLLSDPINMSNLNLNKFTANNPIAEIDQYDNIYLSYLVRDENIDSTDIFFTKFDGESWSTPTNTTEKIHFSSLYQDIEVDSDLNVHIVWQQHQTKLDTILGTPKMVFYYEIFYNNNIEGNWSVPVNISNIPHSDSYKPKMEMYKDQPLVFFQTEYEEISGQDKYYSYKMDEDWIVSKWEVDVNTTSSFEFIVDSLDFIHISTSLLPITQRGDMNYVKGFVNTTSIKRSLEKIPNNLNLKVFPNPFNNYTKIQIFVENINTIEINIYDITGRLVKTIVSSQFLKRGTHVFYWDATNDKGKVVSSGIYFLTVLQNSHLIRSQKIVLFK